MSVMVEPFNFESDLTRKAIGLVCSKFVRLDAQRFYAVDATIVVVSERRKVQAAMFVTANKLARKLHIEYIASRGFGGGSRLVRFLQAQCAKRLFNITAEVRLDNPDARVFFERQGFVFRGRNPRTQSWMGFWHGCRDCRPEIITNDTIDLFRMI